MLLKLLQAFVLIQKFAVSQRTVGDLYNRGLPLMAFRPGQYFPRSYDFYNRNTPRDSAESVNIYVYYESLCPDSRDFFTEQLTRAYEKLGSFFEMSIYPYGKATTTYDSNANEYEFQCQHGPAECYGNKLHSCALDALSDTRVAVMFNACMMDYSNLGQGSDDTAAHMCGQTMNIGADSIIECAQNSKGSLLLKKNGDNSEQINYNYVPYVLINNVVSDGKDLIKDICAAFSNPPEECNSN